MQIRRATEKDIFEIVNIEKLSFLSDAWTEKMFSEEIDNPISCFLVALDESCGDKPIIAGYCISGFIAPYEAYVLSIAVHPDFRGRGIAHSLLSESISEAEKLGIYEYTLEVRVSNEAAIGLYRSMGFREYGIRRGYYSDGEDAYLMKR